MNTTVKKLDKSLVEISGEIATEDFMKHWGDTLKDIGNEVTLEGFRKGHAPENLVIRHVGEETILRDMAERAIAAVYPRILKEHSIDAIGRPAVSLTKIAKDNPLGFTIRTAVTPTVTLPDYKTLAKKALDTEPKDTAVSDDEVERVIKELRQSRAKDGVEPELDNTFASTLGSFATVEELRAKIRENLTHEKESRARDKARIAVIDAIREKTEVSIPDILIEYEVEKILAEMKASAEQMKIPFEHYLGHLKKTEDELRVSWRPDAEKRVAASLILDAIAKKEGLTADPETLAHEVAHMKEHYPDADPERLKIYIENQLLHEQVFALLEK